jgi:hypothetical protein
MPWLALLGKASWDDSGCLGHGRGERILASVVLAQATARFRAANRCCRARGALDGPSRGTGQDGSRDGENGHAGKSIGSRPIVHSHGIRGKDERNRTPSIEKGGRGEGRRSSPESAGRGPISDASQDGGRLGRTGRTWMPLLADMTTRWPGRESMGPVQVMTDRLSNKIFGSYISTRDAAGCLAESP